ncbi:MAG: glycosyltransferase family 4 protein [Lachnospiraceae bacterium]|nr:glycosyltransferase family 4 protein [Lachnospiraceae bacterium]
MKITFVSNYINHHQIPLSNVLYKELGADYAFIQTEPMEEERVKMGWAADFDKIPYLKKYYENEYECQKLIMTSDVVIFGGCEKESLIENRLAENKPVIRYSERLYREGRWKWISPRGLIKKYHDHTRYNNSKVYLLCTGAYVADDFNIIRAYRGKRFKYGYFPEFKKLSDDERKQRRDERRNHTRLEILWVARMLKLKHPESCIELAKTLSAEGINYKITMVGEGEMKSKIEAEIAKNNLSDNFELLGVRKPDEVRELMNNADIFVFTSDYREGWGAVVNEAMNAGCVVIASHAAGAVPTLIKHRQNGLIFPSGDFKKMASLVLEVSKDQKWRLSLGENAYETIEEEWNQNVAGERIIKLCEAILDDKPFFYKSGPLSEAKVIRQNRMYRHLVGMEQ